MGQNIYDTAAFFEAYSHYPRAVNGLTGASEWPLLHSMLPSDLRSMRVLDLGCGDGWFSRWAARQGATSVVGLDESANMLSRARRQVCDPDNSYSADDDDDGDDNDDRHGVVAAAAAGVTSVLSFRQVDMDDAGALARALGAPCSFDFAFSGLALHYVADLAAVLRAVHAALCPGCLFVFSVEHPVFTAPRHPGFTGSTTTTTTTTTTATTTTTETTADSSDNQVWPLTEYFSEGERAVTWLGARVHKQHRTLATYLRALRAAGFGLEAVDEWGATDDESRKHPDWPEGVIPRFLLVSARKLDDKTA